MFDLGDVVAGKYRVDGPCSDSGGMGALVFVSPLEGSQTDKIVLKYCRESNDDYIRRFRREVRVLNEFAGNSKVVQLVDFNLDHDPPFYIMKFYEDGDLTNLTALADDLDLQERVFCQMIDCVQELHSRNKFHRDIKPQNFLLDGGSVVVSDFGLSMELESQTAFTTSSDFWGTQGYLPPEFRTGGFKNADAAGDVFMLGKSFYVLLSGRDPVYLVADDIPEPLFHLIQRCCHVDKQRRYQMLSELKQSLVAVYDVLLNRVDEGGRAWQLLTTINDRIQQDREYVAKEITEFLDAISRLGADERDRICFDLNSSLFHILSQPPFNQRLGEFLQFYRTMVEASNYGWSYAEVIARNMRVLFSGDDVAIQDKTTALELAVYAAVAQHRFAAMDTCRAMITAVKDDNLGLAIQDILNQNAGTFISAIEPSECNCDAVRRIIRQIRANREE